MKITFIIGHLSKERHSLYYELIEDLSKEHEIKVLTSFPSRGISEEARQFYVNNPVMKINNNLVIERYGSKKGEGKNFIIRTLKFINITKNLAKRAKEEETDLIFIESTPPFLGYLAKKLRQKAPIIYNAQDLFPDSLIAMKKFSEKNPLVKYLRKKEKQVYENSDAIITISDDMKNTIITKADVENTVSVVKNWVDTQKIQPIERKDNKLFDLFNLNRDKFYVSYGGNIGYFQNWKVVIEVMKLLKEDDVHFVLFGDGAYKEDLLKQIDEYQLSNVKVFPMQPIELISSVYSLGNLELVPLSENMTKFAFPSKTAQILSTGRPIIGLFDANSEISNEININKLGFAPNTMNSNEIAKFILDYRDGKIVKFDNEYIRNYAITNYDRKQQVKAYNKIIVKIANENRRK